MDWLELVARVAVGWTALSIVVGLALGRMLAGASHRYPAAVRVSVIPRTDEQRSEARRAA